MGQNSSLNCVIKILKTTVYVRWISICMASDLELVHLAFNRVNELSKCQSRFIQLN